MYIIFSVDLATKKQEIVGHVGSNKYRAVASLRKYVELQLASMYKSADKGAYMEYNLGAGINESGLIAVEPEEKLKPGMYIITSNNSSSIDVYQVTEVEIGWIRSIKRKEIKHILSHHLRESKQLDILPKPANAASNHDNLLGELRSVLKTRITSV